MAGVVAMIVGFVLVLSGVRPLMGAGAALLRAGLGAPLLTSSDDAVAAQPGGRMVPNQDASEIRRRLESHLDEGFAFASLLAPSRGHATDDDLLWRLLDHVDQSRLLIETLIARQADSAKEERPEGDGAG